MTVVVKLGTSLVVDGRGLVRRSLLRARAAEIAGLVRAGDPVCVVSSGAIALGLRRLGLERRPRSVPTLQAASALGQARLQAAWESALARERLDAAQVLLTAGDVHDRTTYVNVRNVLATLLRLGKVPVVNENDATATDEITFGDNDALAAQVAVLVRARLLILLTWVDGVYTHVPEHADAELVSEGGRARDVVFGGASVGGRGGMESKVIAAEMAAAAGIPTVIAGGRPETVLGPIAAGDARGTRFPPQEREQTAYELWLRHAKPTAGQIAVDEGARRALLQDGASLLAVGVTACRGSFRAGDAVEVVGPEGAPFAKGIAQVAADDLERRPRGVEAVHRDRLVLL